MNENEPPKQSPRGIDVTTSVQPLWMRTWFDALVQDKLDPDDRSRVVRDLELIPTLSKLIADPSIVRGLVRESACQGTQTGHAGKRYALDLLVTVCVNQHLAKRRPAISRSDRRNDLITLAKAAKKTAKSIKRHAYLYPGIDSIKNLVAAYQKPTPTGQRPWVSLRFRYQHELKLPQLLEQFASDMQRLAHSEGSVGPNTSRPGGSNASLNYQIDYLISLTHRCTGRIPFALIQKIVCVANDVEFDESHVRKRPIVKLLT